MIHRVTNPQTPPVTSEGVTRKGNGKTPEAGRASEKAEKPSIGEGVKETESVSLLGKLSEARGDFETPAKLPDYEAARSSLAKVLQEFGPELGEAYRSQANVKVETALVLLS
jgi:hypothetical protein